MPIPIDATYDPGKNPWLPIEAGTYPAHISGLSSREVKTRNGDAIVFNMTFTIADEAGKLTQTVYEMDGFEYKTRDGEKIPVTNGDGKPEKVNCGHVVSRKFKDRGTFLFTGEEGSGRNRRYFDLLELLDIRIEEIELETGSTVKKLVMLEEDDVMGVPVFVKLGQEEFVTSDTRDLPVDQQETRRVWKVFGIHPWENGEKLSSSELEDDLPF